MKKTIALVVGTRPNFIKIAELIKEFGKKKGIELKIVHTGQHYDAQLSDKFFSDLQIPKPDANLGVSKKSDVSQIARMLSGMEKYFLKVKPDLVIVVGDVNSTLAGALAASKMRIPLARVEAGLRYYYWKETEESNRIIADALSDWLFAYDENAVNNLKKEGISEKRIFLVGNIMIDTLLKNKKRIEKSKVLERFGLKKGKYAVLTMHRQSNVDSKKQFSENLLAFEEIQKKIKIIYPIHPRAKKNLKKFSLEKRAKKMKNLTLCEPLGYLDFQKLMLYSRFIMTDSGGIQEETTVMKKPCLLIEEKCDRPITLKYGTNVLAGTKKQGIVREALKMLKGKYKKAKNIKFWDGKTSERIVKILMKDLGKKW